MNHIFEFYAQGLKRSEDRMIAEIEADTLDHAIRIFSDATNKPMSFLLAGNIYWVMRRLETHGGEFSLDGGSFTKGKKR